ncbi:MAG TPA: hypothetical protein VFF06_13410 [Polyangia bacterium]|nr:hypothetical protein [Polyangia bacterium]
MRAIVILLAATAAGCIVQVNNSANCSDGLQDGLETSIDCGGGVCGPCADGLRCNVNGDCASGLCASVQGQRVCAAQQPAPSCTDLMRNGDETDVDCGGSCSPCAVDKSCLVGADCATGVCSTQHVCLAPTCMDGVQNGTETGVDCGGDCPPCGHLGGSPLTAPPDLGTLPLFFIKAGVGASFNAGEPYFIITAAAGTPTAGQIGSTWTLTWIGDQSATNAYHTFYGSIWTQGTFASITPGCAASACTLEGDDAISATSNAGGGWTRVDFDSNFGGTTTPNGFTFVVTPTSGTNHEPVVFDLYIDNAPGGLTAPYILYPDGNTSNPTMPSASYFGLVHK